MDSTLTNKELYEKLEQAGLAESLKHDSAFQLLKIAANRISEAAIKQLVKTSPDDLVMIVQLQQIIKMYKYSLFSEIEMLKQEGEIAFEELKERGETIKVT